MWIATFVSILVFVSSGSAKQYCAKERCDASCPEGLAQSGNTRGPSGTLVQITKSKAGPECLCYCGVKAGGECDDDDDCRPGTKCIGGISGKGSNAGVCQDICDTMIQPYHQCRTNRKTGKAVVTCNMYKCDPTVGPPVCLDVTTSNGTKFVKYNNECEFVNAKCVQRVMHPGKTVDHDRIDCGRQNVQQIVQQIKNVQQIVQKKA